jgi:alkylhydroperoxidase/carboxymuconolactone decarboxylase family protein YurZ
MTDDTSTSEGSAEDKAVIEDIRGRLEEVGGPIGLAARMNEGILEASGLDLRTFFLVRAAAMAAMGAGTTGWGLNTELMEGDVTADELLGTLTAITPIIGTARMINAADNLLSS